MYIVTEYHTNRQPVRLFYTRYIWMANIMATVYRMLNLFAVSKPLTVIQVNLR